MVGGTSSPPGNVIEAVTREAALRSEGRRVDLESAFDRLTPSLIGYLSLRYRILNDDLHAPIDLSACRRVVAGNGS